MYNDTCTPYDPSDTTELYILDSAYMGAGKFLVGYAYSNVDPNYTDYTAGTSGFALGYLQPSLQGDEICQFSVFQIVNSQGPAAQYANVTYDPSFGIGCIYFDTDGTSLVPYLNIMRYDIKSKAQKFNTQLTLSSSNLKLGDIQFTPSGNLLVAYTVGTSFNISSLDINPWITETNSSQNAVVLTSYDSNGSPLWSHVGLFDDPFGTLYGLVFDTQMAVDSENNFIYFAVPYTNQISFETMSFQGELYSATDPKPINLLLMKLDMQGNMIWYTQSVSLMNATGYFVSPMALDVAVINQQTSILLSAYVCGSQNFGGYNYSGPAYLPGIAVMQLLEQNPPTNYSIPTCPANTPI
jgi:hypothetical protein